MSLKIEDEESSGTKTLTLSGVLDYSTTSYFEKSSGQLEGLKKLIIDFKDLRFIDSTGIYALAKVVIRYQEAGVTVDVQNVSKPIYEIFEILGLINIFGDKVFSLLNSSNSRKES